MVDFWQVFAIMILSNEGRGRSAHGWSSQTRVGSLSRIGCKAEKQGTKIERDDRDVKASLFLCVRQAFRLLGYMIK